MLNAFRLHATCCLLVSLLCAGNAHAQTDSPRASPNSTIAVRASLTEPSRGQRPINARRAGQATQEQRARRLVRRLSLTPEQLRQLREIRRGSAAERQTLAARLREAQQELDAAIYSAEANEPLIEEQVRQVAELQAASVRLRALTELRVRRLLTAEQLQTLRSLQEQVRARRQARRTRNANRLESGDSRPARAAPLPR